MKGIWPWNTKNGSFYGLHAPTKVLVKTSQVHWIWCWNASKWTLSSCLLHIKSKLCSLNPSSSFIFCLGHLKLHYPSTMHDNIYNHTNEPFFYTCDQLKFWRSKVSKFYFILKSSFKMMMTRLFFKIIFNVQQTNALYIEKLVHTET
jgi:hypothetical protein